MNEVTQIGLIQFGITYVLLVIIGIIMKKCGVNQIKLLIIASVRMTVQLVIAGFVLMYIFDNPHPLFTVAYIMVMIGFSIYRVLSKNTVINRKFKWIIAFSIGGCGLSIILFFIIVVVGQSPFNPQYIIPIAGMIMGNAITGVSLAVRSLTTDVSSHRIRINSLISIGASPRKTLIPFVRQSLETALLPTLNSMVGMGIVSLPGMMTGQILSGTVPTTAILYQIAIMIAICAVVCLASFTSLYFGYKTLYHKEYQTVNF